MFRPSHAWVFPAFIALLATDLFASTGPPTLIKPAPATFEFGATCPTGCEHVYFRRKTKINGNWEVTGGPFWMDQSPWTITLDTGEYQIECACGTYDEPPGPDAAWQLCAELIVYRIELQVRRKGSGDEWSGQAKVAAGGMGPDEHKAELRAVGDPPVPGLDFTATIEEGKGLGFPDTGGAASLVLTGPTGADGTVTGTFTSSNRPETVRVLLRPAVDNPEWTEAIDITQVWAIKDENLWTYPDYFVPEVSHDVSFYLRFTDGQATVPITGHTVRFYAWKVVYWVWNDDTWEYEPDEDIVSPTNDLSPLCEFDPRSTQDTTGPGGSGTGEYETTMTVHEDAAGYWFVDEVYFRAIDDNVYRDGE